MNNPNHQWARNIVVAWDRGDYRRIKADWRGIIAPGRALNDSLDAGG